MGPVESPPCYRAMPYRVILPLSCMMFRPHTPGPWENHHGPPHVLLGPISSHLQAHDSDAKRRCEMFRRPSGFDLGYSIVDNVIGTPKGKQQRMKSTLAVCALVCLGSSSADPATEQKPLREANVASSQKHGRKLTGRFLQITGASCQLGRGIVLLSTHA